MGLGVEDLVGPSWEVWAVILDPRDMISWCFVRVDEGGKVLEFVLPTKVPFYISQRISLRSLFVFWRHFGACIQRREGGRFLGLRESWTAIDITLATN